MDINSEICIRFSDFCLYLCYLWCPWDFSAVIKQLRMVLWFWMFEHILQKNTGEQPSIFGFFFLLFILMSDWQCSCQYNLILHQAIVWHTVDFDLLTLCMNFMARLYLHFVEIAVSCKKNDQTTKQNVRDVYMLLLQ